MRWLTVGIGMAALLAGTSAAADTMPLPESGPVHAAVVHALTAVSRGDAAALDALPDEALSTPPALFAPDHPGIAVRWTLLIPWEKLPGTAGVAAHGRLRARLERLAPGLAEDIGEMRSDGSMEIDAGPPLRLGTDRSMSILRRHHPDPLPGPPGWPVPAPNAALAEERDPDGCALQRSGRHLVMTDRSGLPAWQQLLEAGARTWTSADAALVADARGWRWVGLGGASQPLPPLPSGVDTLGVDGGAAFFAIGNRGWRLELLGSVWRAEGEAAATFPAARPAEVDLGDEPLGRPLSGDHACLWLTMHRLVWWTGGAAHTVRHGLPAGRGWSLARGADGRVLVLAADGRSWAVPAWKPGDTGADERLGLGVPAEAAPAMRFRAALAARDWPAARILAGDAADRAALAMYSGEPPPAGADDLPALPRDPAELPLPATAWSGSQAPWARPEPLPGPPTGYDRLHPLLDQSDAGPDEAVPARTRDGLAIDARTWLAGDDGERAELACRDDGRLRWSARWLPEPGLGAPSRALALADGHLLVGEGDARLLAFAAGDGAPALDVRPRRTPVLPGRTWLRLRAGGVAGAIVLHPPGLDDRLGWIAADGAERGERLAQRARWLLSLPDGMRWIAFADGTARALDDSGVDATWQDLHLPADLLASSDPPRLVEGGVAAGSRRWPWRR